MTSLPFTQCKTSVTRVTGVTKNGNKLISLVLFPVTRDKTPALSMCNVPESCNRTLPPSAMLAAYPFDVRRCDNTPIPGRRGSQNGY